MQLSKASVQSQLQQVSTQSLFAISLNHPAQKQEVLREIDVAIRHQTPVTVCIIKP
jgi:hypothetical protein